MRGARPPRTSQRVADRQGTRGVRERLLAAAQRAFAVHGYAATSVRTITAAAECNLAAVNYHFGGKQQLYEALFRTRLAALRQQRVDSVAAAMAKTRGPLALERLLEHFAEAFLEPLVDRGGGHELLALLWREMLDPHLPAEILKREMMAPVQSVLTGALVRLTPGLGRQVAARCVSSIVGQLIQAAHRCRWAEVAVRCDGPAGQLSRTVEHIVTFSAAGVRACAKGQR